MTTVDKDALRLGARLWWTNGDMLGSSHGLIALNMDFFPLRLASSDAQLVDLVRWLDLGVVALVENTAVHHIASGRSTLNLRDGVAGPCFGLLARLLKLLPLGFGWHCIVYQR